MTSETQEDMARKFKLKFRQKIRSRKGTIIFVVLAFMSVSLTGYLPPRPTSISCNDPSINKRLTTETITPLQLLAGSIFGPLIIMVMVDWLSMVSGDEGETAFGCLKKAFQQCRGFFTDMLLAEAAGFFIVEVLKTTVSEPRPHFMQTCAPILTDEMCEQPYIQISVGDCTNPDKIKYRNLAGTMKSFPSGHALLGTISAIFSMVFIQVRLKISWSKYFGIWLQLICLLWALACCFSRIIDNRHHWWDVLAGSIIALFVSIFTIKYLCLWFDPNQRSVSPNKINREGINENNTEKNVQYSSGTTPRLISETSSDVESGIDVASNKPHHKLGGN